VNVSDWTIIQSFIENAAVGQAQLKSTTGEVSTTAIKALLTLPGGQYGFYPQIKSSGAGGVAMHASIAVGINADVQTDLSLHMTSAIGTTYLTRITLGHASGTETISAQQRFVQASPPYDLGDGEVPLFVFAMVDSLGKVIATYSAPDPPWANNGPTIIRPEFVDAQGRGFRRRRKMTYTWAQAKDDPLKRTIFVAELTSAPREVYEITQAVKQADMPLIPHPFTGNAMTGRTIVLIDPVSAMAEKLLAVNDADLSVADLLHGDYLRLDNTPLTRAVPPGVLAVAANWKLTA